jgi:hypothetical protein
MIEGLFQDVFEEYVGMFFDEHGDVTLCDQRNRLQMVTKLHI